MDQLVSLLLGLVGQHPLVSPVSKLISPVPFAQNIVQPRVNSIPAGTDLALNFIRSQTPASARQNLGSYYPALSDPQFVNRLQQADQTRQGLANLLLLQGFHESTLGRGSSNIFGVKPQGRAGQSFASPYEALDYQLGSNVLGGGAGGKLNLLASHAPLTLQDIQTFYKSYDPSGGYVGSLLNTLQGR